MLTARLARVLHGCLPLEISEVPPGIDRDRFSGSAAEGAATAVLVPGRHEQTDQGDGDQTEHDAAEQGFDHRKRRVRGRRPILP